MGILKWMVLSMYLYTIREWLLFFYLYCFFGWIFETTYVSLKQKHFTNRGFMYGPFLPIYGSGAILGLFVTIPVRGNYVLMYFVGAIAATILEYITGVVMEKMFKVRYWDYSYKKYHFQGHICLSSTIAWGFMIIFLVEVIHKPIERLVADLENLWMGNVAEIMVYALTVYFVADYAIAFREAIEFRDILTYLEKAKDEAEHLKEKAKDEAEYLKEKALDKAESIKEKTKDGAEHLKEKAKGEAEAIREKMDEMAATAENVVSSISARKDNIELKARYYKERISKRSMRMVERFYNANPTAVSEHFKETFAELKDAVKKRL